MDPAAYYRSLSRELDAQKDRVRQLIHYQHGLTDGEWKESILRSVLRRHLPPTVAMGRGFIIGERGPSSQIDILLYDPSYPLLHQDGELVFVLPDAVRAIIEVKSTLSKHTALEAFMKLAENAKLTRDGAKRIFVGLFAFEQELGPSGIESVFGALQQAAEGTRTRAVNHICAGPSYFGRFWMNDPFTKAKLSKWYAYKMEQMAAGYFIFNVLEAVVGDVVRNSLWAWFPRDGKEVFKTGEAHLKAPLER